MSKAAVHSQHPLLGSAIHLSSNRSLADVIDQCYLEVVSLTIFLSLLLCLIGLVAYLVVAHAKAAEIARLTFAVGLLAFLLTFASRAAIHIGAP